MNYLEAGLKKLGIESPEKKARLEQYLAEIVRFNPLYGLVSGNDKDEIIVRHILDSLAPWQHILREVSALPPSGSTGKTARREIADVGSGAGLPGIPLAVVMDGCRFLLIEKMAKRVTFLQNVKALLRLSNVAIIEGEVERCGRDGIRVDMALCRGFSAINDAQVGAFSRILKPGGGLMVFYKGKREKIDRETTSCKRLAPQDFRVERYAAPFLNEERHLVIIKHDASA
ncbi:MAG: 16S rRNA (guanine(527)-N(7))-methyltransferase RsmG [Spirochaetaceae bacterium]|jgi:16S rRNA (guanine527-N7)-methyltransferase|nr:16S rRNA (guanine(527)-N(7))-methyltransferase RsmG [Spirochaetaceae bacterium]